MIVYDSPLLVLTSWNQPREMKTIWKTKQVSTENAGFLEEEFRLNLEARVTFFDVIFDSFLSISYIPLVIHQGLSVLPK